MTHVATTRALMQQTVSSLSLDKTQSDVIREISPLAGIASLVLLVTQRCPLHALLCIVVVRMPQDGSKGNILLLQTVKSLVKFVTTGQTIVVDGETTLKSRTVAPFTCMSCKKRLYAGFDTVVSVDVFTQHDTIAFIAVISGLTSKRIEGSILSFVLTLSPRFCAFRSKGILNSRFSSNNGFWAIDIKKREITVARNDLECM